MELLSIHLAIQLPFPSIIRAFPGGASGKEPACQGRRLKRHGFTSWVRKISWRRTWQPTLVFLPGESYGQRSLAGYSPQGHIISTLLILADFVVQSLSHVQLFVTSWSAACQASLSSTISWSLLKLMSIELVMPSNHLVFCRPLLLLSSIFPSIRVFSNELAVQIRWPKYWSFSFSISQ